MMTRATVVACSLLAASLPGAVAQVESSPAAGARTAETQSGQSPAATAVDPITGLVGSWSNAKEGRESPSAIHVRPINLEGADRAYYIEYTAADDAIAVERQEIWRPYETPGGWRLRVLGFHYAQYARIKYGGLWAGEGLLPDVLRAEVYPRYDMDITITDAGFTAATPHRYPVSEGEAVEMEASLEATADSLMWDAVLYSADGEIAWEDEDDELAFHSYNPPVTAVKRDDGLIIIDLRLGEGKKAVNGDTVAMHYTGWNTRYQVFDSSRKPGGRPYPVTLPGRVIRGWQEGLIGIQQGGVRRLIIPGPMAYPGGSPPYIQPNETLHFEVECMELTPGATGGDQ